MDGEKAVEISSFYEENLKGRYFADAENHNAWVNGKWYTCRLKNVIRLCEGLEPLKNDYYYFLPSVKWISGEDEERVEEFLGAWSIESYENDLNEKKYKKAIERKVERIAQQMADMPCVPDEAEAWVEQTIFPENILFFKKRENGLHTAVLPVDAAAGKNRAGNTVRRQFALSAGGR